MPIITKKVDNSAERLLLTGLIVSREFCQSFKSIYTDPDYIQNVWAKSIVGWCLDYFERYDKSPGKHIEKIFEHRSLKMDDDQQDMIARFLQSISKEYERTDSFNWEYVLDKTIDYFKVRSIELLSLDLQYALEKQSMEEAEEILEKFNKVEKVLDRSIEPFNDSEAISRVFQHLAKPLINLDGALGKLINPLMREGRFVSIIAQEKTGKSYFLDELVINALRNGNNVCSFDAGDMTIDQRMERYVCYVSMRPIKEWDCKGVRYPSLDCTNNQTNSCNRKERKCKSGLSIEDPNYSPCFIQDCPGAIGCVYIKEKDYPLLTEELAQKRMVQFRKQFGNKRFKLSCYDSSTLTFEEIERQLDIWERTEGFIPNVVVVDYMDITDPGKKFNDFRHSQDHLWKMGRKLSQKRNVLLIVATQANQERPGKDGAKEEVIKRHRISEDKRKHAHVTGEIGINQTESDRESCIIKVNVVLWREGRYNENRYVSVLQCLEIGRPNLGSF